MLQITFCEDRVSLGLLSGALIPHRIERLNGFP